MTKNITRVLGLDLRPNGLGYAVVELPSNLVNWGVKSLRRKKRRRVLAMMLGLVRKYKPYVVVLEDCEDEKSRRCCRVKRLIGTICREAAKENVAVTVYSREEIKKVFSTFGAETKYEIAHVVAKHLPELTNWLPRPRKVWMGNDDYRMAYFNAVSIILTYHYMHQMRRKK